MHLPWVQLHEDFLERESVVISALLGVPQALVIGMGAMLFKFAVELTSTPQKPPDGVFSDRDADLILERGMGWTGDARKAASAFERAGVLERLDVGMRVRGCHRYLSYWKKCYPKAASTLSPEPEKSRTDTGPEPERHRVGTPSQDKEEEKDPLPSEESGSVQQLSLASAAVVAPERPEDLQQAWNRLAPEPLPRWKGMSDARRKHAKARLKERTLADWEAVIRRIGASRFCRGENERGWLADPDFLLRPGTAEKVLEGKYDDRDARGPAPPDRNVGKSSAQVGPCQVAGCKHQSHSAHTPVCDEHLFEFNEQDQTTGAERAERFWAWLSARKAEPLEQPF